MSIKTVTNFLRNRSFGLFVLHTSGYKVKRFIQLKINKIRRTRDCFRDIFEHTIVRKEEKKENVGRSCGGLLWWEKLVKRECTKQNKNVC